MIGAMTGKEIANVYSAAGPESISGTLNIIIYTETMKISANTALFVARPENMSGVVVYAQDVTGNATKAMIGAITAKDALSAVQPGKKRIDGTVANVLYAARQYRHTSNIFLMRFGHYLL